MWPKRVAVKLRPTQVIQGFTIELNEDGSARLGVTVLIPVPGRAGVHQALNCVCPVDVIQRDAIIALLRGETHIEKGSKEHGQGTQEKDRTGKG